MKIWWEPVLGGHKAWSARTPVASIVAEIKRLYREYPVDDPRRFTSVAIDRENDSVVIRTFREMLSMSGISVRALPVTEKFSEHAYKREDLVFSLRNAVDQGYLKVAPGEEWLLALDTAIKWAATDTDVLGRAACLAWKVACLPPVGV
jgi:hypothetical protein